MVAALLKSRWRKERPPEPPRDEVRCCANCRAKLYDRFCGNCGQKDDDLRRPFWTFFAQLADDLLSLESRSLNSFLYLFFVPGYLTKSYLDGQRERWLPPVRMFLISLVLFFLVAQGANVAVFRFIYTEDRVSEIEKRLENRIDRARHRADVSDEGDEDAAVIDPDLTQLLDLVRGLDMDASATTGALPENVQRRLADQEIGLCDSEPALFSRLSDVEQTPKVCLLDTFDVDISGSNQAESLSTFAHSIADGVSALARDPGGINDRLNIWLPRVMLLLVPLYALVMRFLYWRGKTRHYFNHLVFSLHLHSFIFLIMPLVMLTTSWLGPGWAAGLFFLVPPVYMFIAQKVGYGQAWFKTIFKFFIVSGVHFTLLTTALVASILLAIAG